jgi:dolichol-phosphate mannosyltransferase
MASIAVVIPAFRVSEQLPEVVSAIPDYIDQILVVDDCCPENSGQKLASVANDVRLEIIRNDENLGVGGAVKVGFRRALHQGHDIVVKLDGDGQMDPSVIRKLVMPILAGEADYVKANRFFSASSFKGMPAHRLVGNAGLSFLSKFATGYWSVSDPTNGYVAIRSKSLALLDLDRVHDRYFFECDMLYRASLEQLVVQDVPVEAIYGNEKSSLSAVKSLVTFPWLLARNFLKRILYRYYVREWTAGSLELPAGLILFLWGSVFGLGQYLSATESARAITAGQATFSALALILGLQLLLAFLNGDISSEPKSTRFKGDLSDN